MYSILSGMIMLDMQKAFDTVDHRISCNKLQSMGINQMVFLNSFIFI
jgi:hypothetical protein